MAAIRIDRLIPTSQAGPSEAYDPVSLTGFWEWEPGDEARFSVTVPESYRMGSDLFLRIQESTPSASSSAQMANQGAPAQARDARNRRRNRFRDCLQRGGVRIDREPTHIETDMRNRGHSGRPRGRNRNSALGLAFISPSRESRRHRTKTLAQSKYSAFPWRSTSMRPPSPTAQAGRHSLSTLSVIYSMRAVVGSCLTSSSSGPSIGARRNWLKKTTGGESRGSDVLPEQLG